MIVIENKSDLLKFMKNYYAKKRMKITLPQCVFQANKKSFEKGKCDELRKFKKN